MKILLTNDDGIKTKSTFHLAKLLKKEGHEVDIVIPVENMSGIGTAMYFRKELVIDKLDNGIYTVTGTPSDCVNLVVAGAILENNYDLILSGINSGENAGFTVYDSGTVAAARRAKIYGYNSIAASYENINTEKAEMEIINKYLVSLLNKNNFFMKQDNGEFVNINIPEMPKGVDIDSWINDLKVIETHVGQGKYLPFFSKLDDNKFIYDNQDCLDKGAFANGCDHDTITKGMVSLSKIKLF